MRKEETHRLASQWNWADYDLCHCHVDYIYPVEVDYMELVVAGMQLVPVKPYKI
jgi:hypothetical protein